MNTMIKRLSAVAVALIALSSGQSVMAAAWSNAAGAAPSGHFSWTGGGDLNGLFGSPIVTANDRFVFNTGAGFGISDTTPGDAFAATQGDTVSWDLHLSPGFQLTGVEVRVRGVYAVGGTGSYVDLVGTLSVTELSAQFPEPFPRTETGLVVASPNVFPITPGSGSLAGAYSGVSTVDVSFYSPMFDNDLHISFENLLTAFAGLNGNASLDQTFQSFEIEVSLVPEPATLSVLALCGIAVIRRRRR